MTDADILEQIMAMVVLGVALLLFLLSTRQWPLSARAPIWVGGAGLIGWSLLITHGDAIHYGLARAIGDAFTQPGSILGLAFDQNFGGIGGSLAPMLDVMVFFCTLMGVLSLVAFTPGEEVERVIRPILIGLMGAVFGGLVALSLVALGFGGYSDRKVFFGALSEANVIDGDTIAWGDARLELAGVDAPERRQYCYRGYDRWRCGTDAQVHLYELAKGHIVVCRKQPAANSSAPGVFTPPVVQCLARTPAGEIDLGKQMVADGFALAARNEDDETSAPDYSADAERARRDRRGLWATCALTPAVWRAGGRLTREYEERRITRADDADFINVDACKPIRPTPPSK